MRVITTVTVVSFVALLFPAPLPAADTGIEPEKMAAIERLIEASGQAELMKQGMLAMIDQMRPAMAELPQEFFDEFKKAALGDELMELLIPVYDRHFTSKEIEELTRFYESPIGQTLVSKQPLVQQDAMGVGQQWGQRKALEIMEDLRERGVLASGHPGGSSQVP